MRAKIVMALLLKCMHGIADAYQEERVHINVLYAGYSHANYIFYNLRSAEHSIPPFNLLKKSDMKKFFENPGILEG